MRTRLQLFLNWGITFDEPYTVPERTNRAVAYANRVDLENSLPVSGKGNARSDDIRGYPVKSHGKATHAQGQEKAEDEKKHMKTFEEDEGT